MIIKLVTVISACANVTKQHKETGTAGNVTCTRAAFLLKPPLSEACSFALF